MTEMARVLVPGGRLLVYVWAKDQKKQELSSYLKQNKANFKPMTGGPVSGEQTGQYGLPVHVNRSGARTDSAH